jgi:predicted Fe-Mo cluster-binding NifX family protein
MKVMVKIFAPIKLNQNQDTFELENVFLNESFGRTPHYILFDTNNEQYDIIQNTNHHFGGNDTPMTIIARNQPDIVLASHLGTKPFNGINGLGVKIKRANAEIPLVNLFKSVDKLEDLPEPLPGASCGCSHK